MAKITVTGRDDLGFSPKFGDIRKGQKYTIEETDFAIELFIPPKGFDTKPYEPQPVVVDEQPAASGPLQTVASADQTNQEVL